MTLVEKIYTDIRKVQFIYNNQLHTHFVSHEETYEPDDTDGDFAEPLTLLICCPIADKSMPVGFLMLQENEFCPKLTINKDSVLIVETA
jgi:hypothetical protein